MPVELKSIEEFIRVSERAIECRVKEVRKSDIVKVKARTRRVLYTIKVKKDQLEELLGKLKCGKIVFVDTGEVREAKKESS